jgi:ABC-type spermidine/putrescine transport system permease subunit I
VREDRRQGVSLLVPGLALLVLLFYLPQLLMLVVSLGRRTAYGGVERSLSPANYLRAVEPLYLAILWRSLVLAAVTTVLCLLVAYPVAWWIARRAPARWRNALLALVILPFWTSFLIRVYAWIAILKPEGLLNQALLGLGLIGAPLDILNTDFAILIGIVSAYLPFMILPIYASLVRQDPTLAEAAADLGASPLAIFWRVTFPLSLPGVAAGFLLVFIPAMGEFVIPDLLGGSDTLMVGRLVWTEFFSNRDWPVASALAITLLFILVPPILLARRMQERAR